MGERAYTIIVHPEDEGGYSVTVPALPGFVTQRKTADEAIIMAKDAIALYVEYLAEKGLPIPEETEPPRAILVTVAA